MKRGTYDVTSGRYVARAPEPTVHLAADLIRSRFVNLRQSTPSPPFQLQTLRKLIEDLRTTRKARPLSILCGVPAPASNSPPIIYFGRVSGRPPPRPPIRPGRPLFHDPGDVASVLYLPLYLNSVPHFRHSFSLDSAPLPSALYCPAVG